MSTSYPPHYAYPSAPPLERALPHPPRLHWGWVLLLTLLTVGIFASVWLVVQALWVRRMRGGKSAGFVLAVVNLAWLPLIFLFAFALGLANAMAPTATTGSLLATGTALLRLSNIAVYLATVFVLRSEMNAAPIELDLSGLMTFLFGTFYFQYNLQDYGLANAGLSLNAVSPVTAEASHYPTAEEVGVSLHGAQRASPGEPSPLSGSQDPASH